VRARPIASTRSLALLIRFGLVPSSTMDLHREYQRNRDPLLLEALVERHTGLTRQLPARFAGRGEEVDDLAQVAACGLLSAIERFDPARGYQLTTFGTATIRGELKRHFRDRCWAVQIPRRTQEGYLGIRDTIERLQQELRRSSSAADIVASTSPPSNDVRDAIAAGGLFRPVRSNVATDDQGIAAEDLLGGPCPWLREAEDRQEALAHLRSLPETGAPDLWLRSASTSHRARSGTG
jgi:RNA polymerase sigma-B factor